MKIKIKIKYIKLFRMISIEPAIRVIRVIITRVVRVRICGYERVIRVITRVIRVILKRWGLEDEAYETENTHGYHSPATHLEHTVQHLYLGFYQMGY